MFTYLLGMDMFRLMLIFCGPLEQRVGGGGAKLAETDMSYRQIK